MKSNVSLPNLQTVCTFKDILIEFTIKILQTSINYNSTKQFLFFKLQIIKEEMRKKLI